MDKETKSRLCDYFDPWELVELLDITTEDIIDAFEDKIEEAIDDLEEIMGLNNDED